VANQNQFHILEFDAHGIAIMKVRRSAKGLQIAEYTHERGDWSTDDEIETALRAFAKKHDLARTTLYTVLPRYEMTARILTLPSQDMAEIGPMVRNTAEDYVPYPEHELVIDATILEKLDDGQARVFATFAHNDVVDTHVARLNAAGIEPARLFVSTACIASAAAAAAGGPGDRIAFVWLGFGGVEVLVFNGRHLEYARAIAGAQDWSKAAHPDSEELEELGVELRSSLAAHRRESEEGLGAESVVVCSEWADASPIAEALAGVIGYDCDSVDLLSRNGADNTDLSCQPAAALGAALAAQDRAASVIDLVPTSLVRTRAARGMKHTALRVAGLAIVIVAGFVGLYVVAAFQRQSYIEELRSRVAAIEESAQSVAVKRSQLGRIQRQVDASGSALELLSHLSRQAPNADLNITSYVFSHGKELTIRGRAVGDSDFDRLTEDLRELGRDDVPLFRRASQGPWKQVRENNKEIYQYEIRIPFPRDESEEDDSEFESDFGDNDV